MLSVWSVARAAMKNVVRRSWLTKVDSPRLLAATTSRTYGRRRIAAASVSSTTLNRRLARAVLWSVFVRHRVPAESTMTPPVAAAHDTTPPPASPPAPPAGTTTTSQGVGPDTGGLSYMDALARSETRRRIRASAGVTYLNEIVAASQDSMLHRWDNRARHPVRVYG